MIDRVIEDEIVELEEIIASLTRHDDHNAEVAGELRNQIMRLKERLAQSRIEELYNDERPLPMGGEV